MSGKRITFLGVARKATDASPAPFIMRGHQSGYIGVRQDSLTGEFVNLIGRSDRPPVPGTREVFPGVRVLNAQ